MCSSMLSDITLTPLKKVKVSGGDVLHAMKSSDFGYNGFGEAYFSVIKNGALKGWKRHNKMSLNLVVPYGKIRFVIYDDRNSVPLFKDVILSRENYMRLTVPPGLWVGFQGVDEDESILLNIADIEHDPKEVDRKEISEIKFDWGQRK